MEPIDGITVKMEHEDVMYEAKREVIESTSSSSGLQLRLLNQKTRVCILKMRLNQKRITMKRMVM
ncbi:hypothetical protein C0J52_16664 [Blattella germanica]|nr:hypothetical protein C0J52_16664 [Blattella germanica]